MNAVEMAREIWLWASKDYDKALTAFNLPWMQKAPSTYQDDVLYNLQIEAELAWLD